ncbi:hypothetical protein [Sphingomonas sp. TZW2008]|uniref:hypothetical protein n=1 Tax=Sphingomonas sp. TZW2008 TaxID=1917973 RepID=UPI0015C502B3|nr:hypothetical protein [Sphingomonas sp. TZW2008]
MIGGAQIALIALTLVLPLAALIARRPPLGTTIKLAAIWIAIFAVVVAVAALIRS